MAYFLKKTVTKTAQFLSQKVLCFLFSYLKARKFFIIAVIYYQLLISNSS